MGLLQIRSALRSLVKSLIILILLAGFIWCLCKYIGVCRTFWFNERRILGQDKQMQVPPEHEYTNYPNVIFRLEKESPGMYCDFYNTLHKALTDNPTHLMRMNIKNKDEMSYTNDMAENILNYSLQYKDMTLDGHKSIENIHYTLIDIAISNPNKFLLYVLKDAFIIIGSHEIYDGRSSFELAKSLSNLPDIKLGIPPYTFVPIYNEYLMCRSILPMLKMYFNSFSFKTLKCERNLYPICNWNDDMDVVRTSSERTDSSIAIDFLKYIKRQYEMKRNEGIKVSFNSVLNAYQILQLFSSTSDKSRVDKLVVGIVIAFSNTCRRNNFTAIPITVYRPDGCVGTGRYVRQNFEANMFNLIEQVNAQMEANQYMLYTIYSMSNIYEHDTYINNNIDVLLSNIPMNRTETPLTYNNAPLKDAYCDFRGFASPVYYCSLSDHKNVYLSCHSRTRCIEHNKLSTFNKLVDEYAQQTKYIEPLTNECEKKVSLEHKIGKKFGHKMGHKGLAYQ